MGIIFDICKEPQDENDKEKEKEKPKSIIRRPSLTKDSNNALIVVEPSPQKVPEEVAQKKLESLPNHIVNRHSDINS